MVLLKHLSDFWRTSEIHLINCEINLILTCSDKCVLSNDIKATADTKLYVPVVTLSTQDNVKLLKQLNQVSKEQLTGTNMNQKYQYKHQTHI